ncbi:MAG: type III PLP-dependent enzyme [Alphaproteobacteria bacterium]|nr:type III PLP-dependent enzyme [Alphaproteobacteria bacterium]
MEVPMARHRLAVAPLRRRFETEAPAELPRVDALVAAERPADPMHCLRPRLVAATARRFLAAFPGEAMYAVKCNPEPRVLRALWAGGVRQFDCASPAEVALVRQMFGAGAEIRYMHPVKGRAAIRDAYRLHGVRDFSFDSADELAKLREEARSRRGVAAGLGLHVRLALPKGEAVYDLSGKFGAPADAAAALLAQARPHAERLGLCFHVGSQTMGPQAYRDALALAGQVIAHSGVAVDVIDVGGGFPVSYPGLVPAALDDFVAAIREGVAALGMPGIRLWAEPGRALVAAGVSVVVQVHHRRGDALYINDGIYGSLSDAGAPGFRFPARLIRAECSGTLTGFELFGPTCDSADRMRGPFLLPDDVREGDYIEIGQLGAYGGALRTAFNGFDRAHLVDVGDPPLLQTPGHPTA